MTDDLYKRASDLQRTIAAKREELAELEDELKTILIRIQRDNITSTEFMMVPARTPVRKIMNMAYFRDNHPAFYRNYAHLDHAHSVSMCAVICGGYTEFQHRLRSSDPDMFDKYASIALDDLSQVFSADQIKEFEDQGIIARDAPKSWRVQPKPLYMTDHPHQGEIRP